MLKMLTMTLLTTRKGMKIFWTPLIKEAEHQAGQRGSQTLEVMIFMDMIPDSAQNNKSIARDVKCKRYNTNKTLKTW